MIGGNVANFENYFKSRERERGRRRERGRGRRREGEGERERERERERRERARARERLNNESVGEAPARPLKRFEEDIDKRSSPMAVVVSNTFKMIFH